jgi:hypothetical protein
LASIRSTDIHRTKKNYPAHLDNVTTRALQAARFSAESTERVKRRWGRPSLPAALERS